MRILWVEATQDQKWSAPFLVTKCICFHCSVPFRSVPLLFFWGGTRLSNKKYNFHQVTWAWNVFSIFTKSVLTILCYIFVCFYAVWIFQAIHLHVNLLWLVLLQSLQLFFFGQCMLFLCFSEPLCVCLCKCVCLCVSVCVCLCLCVFTGPGQEH